MDADLMVRGEGRVRVLPDRAVVRADIEGEGASRDDAYGSAAALATAVDEVLSGYGEAIDTAMTAALVVHPKTRWRRGESVRTGWRAARTSVLEVTAFERLGELIAELAVAGASVSGPLWHIDPDNPAYTAARQLAAADARRRADEYAAALGLEIDAVAWIAEPGMRGTGGPFPTGARQLAMAAAVSREPAEIIEVTPDEMTIEAAVEVGFSLRRAAGA